MKKTFLLMLLLASCEKPGCREHVAEPGRACIDHKLGAYVSLERTSPQAPPVAVCRCPSKEIAR